MNASISIYEDVKLKSTDLDTSDISCTYFTPFVKSILDLIHQISKKIIKIEKFELNPNIYKWSLRDVDMWFDTNNKWIKDMLNFKEWKKDIDLYSIFNIDMNQNHEVEIREDHILKWTWSSFERNGFLCIHMFALLDYLEIEITDNLNLIRDTWLKMVPTVKDLTYKCKTFMRFFSSY